MRSTSGYLFSFGFGIFSWHSKKQYVIAQSTTEAEYVVATAAVNQALDQKAYNKFAYGTTRQYADICG